MAEASGSSRTLNKIVSKSGLKSLNIEKETLSKKSDVVSTYESENPQQIHKSNKAGKQGMKRHQASGQPSTVVVKGNRKQQHTHNVKKQMRHSARILQQIAKPQA